MVWDDWNSTPWADWWEGHDSWGQSLDIGEASAMVMVARNARVFRADAPIRRTFTRWMDARVSGALDHVDSTNS